jgi:hypothetical protein
LDSELSRSLQGAQQYYKTHQDFFAKQGYNNFNDPQLLPLRFPVAQLKEIMPRAQLLTEIQQRQQVSRVYIQ